MKLGIFLLIFGLILAGGGVAVWMYADPETSFWFGGYLSINEARMYDAGGMGVAVAGGLMVIGGIVRMIVKK